MARSRRCFIAGTACAYSMLAGCLGSGSVGAETTSPSRTTPTTPTTTDPSDRFSGPSVSLPPGPKDPPERPDPLTAESVERYVRLFERAYLYNEYYPEHRTVVSFNASVHTAEVFDLSPGFAVGVQSGGNMDYGDPSSTTVHADFWEGIQSYLVDSDTTLRESGKPCKNVAAIDC